MTLAEVAERLRCSTKTVRRRIASGELRAARIARGVWVIREEDLAAFLAERAHRPREARPRLPAPAATPIVPAGPRTPRRRGGANGKTLSELVRELERERGRDA
jgi:excisionase family DNA binding protein